jgi:ribosome biogenesis protein NSA2
VHVYSIKSHEEKDQKSSAKEENTGAAVPTYLLDREHQTNGKVLSNMIKQKRKEKAVCI